MSVMVYCAVLHFVLAFWSTGSSTATPTSLTDTDRQRITQVVDSTLSCSDIPGLALSVVGYGQVLLEQGFGGRSGPLSRTPVTADTLFPLGSITKAFTTSLLAMLIDKHADRPTRFNWSTPIRNILGDSFALYNEQLTSETTLEDILSHRTGIPDYFLLLMAGYPYDITRQQLVRSLKYHKPQFAFRSEFVYNNHMYILAGYIAEVLENRRWEDLITSYLLQPLGMTSTTFVDEALLTSRNNIAKSCGWTNGSCQPVELHYLDTVNVAGPAGAIVSTAHDMSNWLLWHLAGGTVASKSLIDKRRLWETYRERNVYFGPYMTARDTKRAGSPSSPSPSSPAVVSVTAAASSPGAGEVGADDTHVAYDLGWMTSYYRGFRRVWHSGGISTYKTQVWMYPEVGIAMFVTVSGPNRQDTTWALTSLLHKISDILLTSPETALSLAPEPAPSCSQSHGPDSLPTRPRPVSPSRHLDKLIGTYFSDKYVINVTIAYDRSATGRLLIFIGRYLTAELQYLDTGDIQFNAVVKGALRWFTDPLFPVRFVMPQDGDRAVAVSFPLYSPSPNNTSDYDDWAMFSRVSSGSSTSTQITWSTVLWSAIGIITIGLQNYNLM